MQTKIASLLLCLLLTMSAAFAQEKTNGASDKPKIVNLSLSGDPVDQALRKLFEAAGESFLLDRSVPTGTPPMTAYLKDVGFETALKLICQAADLTWKKEGNIYVISKSGAAQNATSANTSTTPNIVLNPLDTLNTINPFLAQNPNAVLTPTIVFNPAAGGFDTSVPVNTVIPFLPSNNSVILDPSTLPPGQPGFLSFTCPHCKKSGNVYVEPVTHRCPTCQRQFGSDWNFCPFDGTAKPDAAKSPAAVRRCPFCGKSITGTGQLFHNLKAQATKDGIEITFTTDQKLDVEIVVLTSSGRRVASYKGRVEKASGAQLARFNVNGKKFTSGSYTVQVVAHDSEGKSTTEQVSVKIP